jgi:hypothetical protein
MPYPSSLAAHLISSHLRYMVKSMSGSEHAALLSMLPLYTRHMHSHPASTITRIFGVSNHSLEPATSGRGTDICMLVLRSRPTHRALPIAPYRSRRGVDARPALLRSLVLRSRPRAAEIPSCDHALALLSSRPVITPALWAGVLDPHVPPDHPLLRDGEPLLHAAQAVRDPRDITSHHITGGLRTVCAVCCALCAASHGTSYGTSYGRHEVFDMKGSWVDRHAKAGSKTRLDSDWDPSRKLNVSAAGAEALLRQVCHDAHFLSHNIT